MRVIPAFFLRDMYRYLHPQNMSTPPSIPSTSSLPNPTPHTTTAAAPSPPKTSHYSPFLHLALLAVASAFSDTPHIAHPATRTLLVNAAKAHIEAECARPSVSAVMALGLLGSYFSGRGEQTVGFVYFGMSARLSQARELAGTALVVRILFSCSWIYFMPYSRAGRRLFALGPDGIYQGARSL